MWQAGYKRFTDEGGLEDGVDLVKTSSNEPATENSTFLNSKKKHTLLSLFIIMVLSGISITIAWCSISLGKE